MQWLNMIFDKLEITFLLALMSWFVGCRLRSEEERVEIMIRKMYVLESGVKR